MATTIAKLAAVLTTDTAGFDAGMNRASQKIDALGKKTAASNAAMAKSAQKLAGFAGAFGDFGGLIGPLSTFIGPWGLLATAIGAAGVAAYTADQHLKEVGQNFANDKIKAMQDYAAAFERLNGSPLPGFRNESTRTSEETKRLIDLGKSSIRDEFSKYDLGRYLVSFSASSKEALVIGEAMQKKLNDLKAKTVKLIEEAIEKEKRLAEEQREAAAQFERLQSRGRSLTESLRTPIEVMRDAFKEVADLAAGGFIEGETLTRGLAKAAGDYRDAAKRMASNSRSVGQAGALERGSVAEYSARIKAESEQKEQTRLAKESLTVEKDILTAIKATQKDQGKAIKVARLN